MGDELGAADGSDVGAYDVGSDVGDAVAVAVGAVVGDNVPPPPAASNSCKMCIAASTALSTAS